MAECREELKFAERRHNNLQLIPYLLKQTIRCLYASLDRAERLDWAPESLGVEIFPFKASTLDTDCHDTFYRR